MNTKSNQADIAEFDLQSLSNDDLVVVRLKVEQEMKKRKLRFSTGEIGESLAIHFFNSTAGLDNLQKAPVGTKCIDAISRKGHRYSIKTIKDGGKTGTIYPDKEVDSKLFEYLLLVLLDEDYELRGIYRFSWRQFEIARRWDTRMNAWYIPKSLKSFGNGETIYERQSSATND